MILGVSRVREYASARKREKEDGGPVERSGWPAVLIVGGRARYAAEICPMGRCGVMSRRRSDRMAWTSIC
jgi:hypothetical protein